MDEKIIFRYLDGVAQPQEKEELLLWLRENPENKKTFVQIKLLHHRLNYSKWSRHSLVRALNSLNHAIDRQGRRSVMKGAGFWRVAVLAATVVLLVLFSIHRISDVRDTVTLFNSDPVNMKVLLPDSTVVWMSQGTELSYLCSNSRRLKINGEALFDVAKDPLHPFVVEGKKMQVIAYGTIFHVRSYDSSPYSETILAEGKVSVCDARGRELMCMTPNQKVIYGYKDNTLEVKEVSAEEILETRYGMVSIPDATVRDIARRIGSEYGVEVSVSGESSDMDSVYTFNFMRNATFEDVAELFRIMTRCTLITESL